MLRPTRAASLALAFLTAASLGACKKATVDPEMISCFPAPQTDTAARLVGHWELTQTAGGLAGRTQPADPAQKQEIVFGADGKATFYLNGTITRTAAFTLTQAVAYVTGQPQTYVVYDFSSSAPRQFIDSLTPTTLVIADDYADGLGYTYSRR